MSVYFDIDLVAPDALAPTTTDAELYRQGRFPFDKLVKFYPFDQINEAVRDSESGVTLKPILTLPK
jgi:aryl-alcohol dehydrogenase